MTDAQRNGAGGGWQPHPQGEYDADATAFVQLPEGAVDAVSTPLAAPGHGYVPPQITVAPTAADATDPAATGVWVLPPEITGVAPAPVDAPVANWPDPAGQPGLPVHEAYDGPGHEPHGAHEPHGPHGSYEQHVQDAYDPRATGQWTFPDAVPQEQPAPGHPHAPAPAAHDVTGQWSIPVADGDLPDESGEFTTSSLAQQWGGTPPATLPGGAPAPWASALAAMPEPMVPQAPEAFAEQPFAEQPPLEQPPLEQPPLEQPPLEQPPVGQPPLGSPPVEQPQGEQPPVEPPAVEETPFERTAKLFVVERRPDGSLGPRGGVPEEAAEPQPLVAPEPEPFVAPEPQLVSAPEPVTAEPEPPVAQEPEPEPAPVAAEVPAPVELPEAPALVEPAVPEEPVAAPEEPEAEAPAPAPEAAPEPEPELAPAPEPAPVSEEPAPEASAPAPEQGPAPAPEAGLAGEPAPVPHPEPASETAPEPAPAIEADAAPPAEAGPDAVADVQEAAAEAAPVRPEAPAEPRPHHDEHPLVSYVLRVNGADRPVTDAWIGESLLYVLRERLGLAGAKDGCSQGECGACNVQVDGRLVASCLVPAATTASSEVRTVEGLAADGQPSDVQRALANCGAVQCGFCVPGMAMTLHDLLEGNPAPSDLEARRALCGNLCRCSGYRGVLDAVRDVVAERAAKGAAEQEQDGQAAGQTRIPHQAGPYGQDGEQA
ncbi:Nicotinate dehydrogenase small FeS subunit [Streptomyces sp. YIM 121038]|uniref:2Fe-2S iron-sulfur cluster-binding protein n=1 Tax=Streptomyces sp. YIM 121038 TaxID=2136401 RepID=UPI001164ED4C|nr:2Fe-2S iron-sulfur cluster-binding protein [Streptomyces sp. YIM 121038]QCX76913.1 Nicotinate dehydrogenase small FeS subunit [Streptomyces sp. YIM 121038]